MPNFQSAPGAHGFQSPTSNGFEALGFPMPILLWRFNITDGSIVSIKRYIRKGSSYKERILTRWKYINANIPNDYLYGIGQPILDTSGNIIVNSYAIGKDLVTFSSRMVSINKSDEVRWDIDGEMVIWCILDNDVYGYYDKETANLIKLDNTTGIMSVFNASAFTISDLGFNPATDEIITGTSLSSSINSIFQDGSNVWILGPYYTVLENGTDYRCVFLHKFDPSSGTFTEHLYFDDSVSGISEYSYLVPYYTAGLFDGFLYYHYYYDGGNINTISAEKYLKIPFPSLSTRYTGQFSSSWHIRHHVMTDISGFTAYSGAILPSGRDVVLGNEWFSTIIPGEIRCIDVDGNEKWVIDNPGADSLAFDGTYLCGLGRGL